MLENCPPLSAPLRHHTTQIREPEHQNVIDLRSEILKILLEIDGFAAINPSRRVSIRNRTRESITRQLHYERNEERLTKMKSDARKLLAMWHTPN